MGVRSLTSSSLVGGYLGLVFLLSDKLREMECPRGEQRRGKTVSSALKSENTSKHSLFHFQK